MTVQVLDPRNQPSVQMKMQVLYWVSSVWNFCWKGLKGRVLPSIKEGVWCVRSRISGAAHEWEWDALENEMFAEHTWLTNSIESNRWWLKHWKELWRTIRRLLKATEGQTQNEMWSHWGWGDTCVVKNRWDHGILFLICWHGMCSMVRNRDSLEGRICSLCFVGKEKFKSNLNKYLGCDCGGQWLKWTWASDKWLASLTYHF